MEEEKLKSHKISLIERNNLQVSGVKKVLSSNINNVVLDLKDTKLTILGENLSIENFGENSIEITGTIDAIKYSKTSKIKEGIFKRIFK